MPQPSPEPPRSASGLAARLTDQATALRETLHQREQRAADDGPEHDHGLHHLATRLLATVAEDVVPQQPPTDQAVARLVRDAEPLREALLLREDAATAAAWPEEQRARIGAELARAGVELPKLQGTAALRPGTSG